MRKRLFKKEKTEVDELIHQLLGKMEDSDAETPEYSEMLATLERLYKIKTAERPGRVSPDTAAVIAGNLFGILMIIIYEQKHVMSSKGFGQLLRPKQP